MVLVSGKMLQQHFYPFQLGLFPDIFVKRGDPGVQVLAEIHEFPNLFATTAHGVVLLGH
jgi:hypothetical protein